MTRKNGKPEETYRAGVNFLGVDASTIPNGQSLLQAIIGAARGDGGVSTSAPLPFLPSATDLAEWMVGLRPASPLLKGLDVMAVTSGGSHALALFPFGQRPTVDSRATSPRPPAPTCSTRAGRATGSASPPRRP